MNSWIRKFAGRRLRLKLAVVVILGSLLSETRCEFVPFAEMPTGEMKRLYEQARFTPGAKQVGLSCAFFANVPILTMIGGINIADDSMASRDFAASIYGLRRGDFSFMSAFDRGMFFDLFHIPSKSVKKYYREASRGDLLADAEEVVSRDLALALDQGQFVSLRILGEFGGPHNVLLLAHRRGNFYYHDPRNGTIKSSPAAELASNILTVSKARSKTLKRYFSAYHLISIPAPERANRNPLKLGDLAADLELVFTESQQTYIVESLTGGADERGIGDSFPRIDFALAKGGEKSAINDALPVENLKGVFNLTKLAINSYQIGARNSLPVWMMKDGPVVAVGYSEGEGGTLIFSNGDRRIKMKIGDAMIEFKKSGCFVGYIQVTREE